MELVKYSVDNFKSIRHGEFDATSTTVIIGKNNSGKSNIAESLKVFKDKIRSSERGVDSELDRDWFSRCVTGGNTDEEITWELTFQLCGAEREQIRSNLELRTRARRMELEDVLSEPDFTELKVILTADGYSSISTEYAAKFDGRLVTISDIQSEDMYANGNNYSVRVNESAVIGLIRDSVSSWSFVDPIREPENVMDSIPSYSLDGRGTELVQVLHYLYVNERDVFVDIRDSFLNIMNGISDMRSRFDEDLDEPGKITVMTDESGFNTRFKLSELSSGSKDILVLITQAYLSREDTDLLAVEEPELHLHPDAERQVFSILNDISEENSVQILVSTHSEVFVNQVEVEDVVRTERDGETITRHIEEGKVEDELADLGYDQSDILQAEGVVFVEGRSDRMILPELCRTNGLDTKEQGIEIVELEGEGNTRRNARSLVKVLFSFDIPYLFVIDSHGEDSSTVETEYLDLVNRTDNDGSDVDPDTIWWHTEPRHFHIWDGYGIESYLICPEAIASTLNVDVAEVEAELQEAEDSPNVDQEDKGEILEYAFRELRPQAMDTEAIYSKEQDGRAIATQMDEEHLPDEMRDVIEKIRLLPSERPQDNN
jgi:putative ATP-dependent endonuclease of OLD family